MHVDPTNYSSLDIGLTLSGNLHASHVYDEDVGAPISTYIPCHTKGRSVR